MHVFHENEAHIGLIEILSSCTIRYQTTGSQSQPSLNKKDPSTSRHNCLERDPRCNVRDNFFNSDKSPTMLARDRVYNKIANLIIMLQNQ